MLYQLCLFCHKQLSNAFERECPQHETYILVVELSNGTLLGSGGPSCLVEGSV